MPMRRLVAGLLLVVLSTQTGPVAVQTKVLRVVPHADLTQLDPGFAAILITREYGLMVFEELFAWDAKLQPKPQMVESWTTSPDGLIWRFTLRDGLKFHDGQAVTTRTLSRRSDAGGARSGGCETAAATAWLDPVDHATFELTLNNLSQPPVLSGSGAGSCGSSCGRRTWRAIRKPVSHGDWIRSVPLQSCRAYQRRADRIRPQPRLRAAPRACRWAEWRSAGEGRPCRMAGDPRCVYRVRGAADGEVDIWEHPNDLVPSLSQKLGRTLQRA